MTIKTWMAALLAGAMAVGAAGCVAGTDEPEATTGEAQEAQLDPQVLDYAVYNIFQNGTLAGRVMATRTTGLTYVADREYWYMLRNLNNTSTITFSGGTAYTWATAPSLGALSFQTSRVPHWSVATPPAQFFQESEIQDGTTVYTGLQWRMTQGRSGWTGNMVWWHSNQSNVLGPNRTDALQLSTPADVVWYRSAAGPLF